MSDKISKFVIYWKDKYDSNERHPVRQLIDPINFLVRKIISLFTPSGESLSYDLKRTVIRIVHDQIFHEDIHRILLSQYKKLV